MKLIPNLLGDHLCGWNSDDAAGIYWYRTDRTPTPPETLTAHVIGHYGLVTGPRRTVQVADLEFLGAGLFGEPRGSSIKWSGDSYRYGFYALSEEGSCMRHHVIIRLDGGGIYVYVDMGHTEWRTLCATLPPERLWDLGQVIGHTYEKGVEHERARLYQQLADDKIKRTKVRGRNAYQITETH